MTTRAPGFLDELLPIRRITVDGVETPFVRDIDFSSETMDVEVNEAAGVVTVGVKPEAVSRLSAWKDPVRAVRDSPVETSGHIFGGDPVDGVTLATGDRVAVVGATDPEDNGIYVFRLGINDLNDSISRAEDFDDADDMKLGTTFCVLEGDAYGGSTWRLTSPTTGEIDPGVTELVFARFDPENGIPASGDDTGAIDRARIAAILAAGKTVRLVAGETYHIDEPLSVPSGARLELNGATILLGSAWVDTSADDRTGAMFRVRGATTADVNTTLAAHAVAGDKQITTVGSVVAGRAGTWIKIAGEVGPIGEDSDNTSGGEWLRIADDFAGGTTVTLATTVMQPRKSGGTVQSGTPAIGVVIVGPGRLNGSDALCAVGIEVTDAVDFEIAGKVSFRGFSRDGVDVKHSRRVEIETVFLEGNINGGLFVDSCEILNVGTVVGRGEIGGRRHAEGVVRPAVWVYNNSVDTRVGPVDVRGMCGGYRQWGGLAWSVDSIDASDLELADIITTMPADEGIDDASQTEIGCALDGGTNLVLLEDAVTPCPYTAFGYGGQIGRIVASDIKQPNTRQLAVHLHDHRDLSIGQIMLLGRGRDPDSAGSYMSGIGMKDVNGHIDSVVVRGVSRAICTYGSDADVTIGALRHSGSTVGQAAADVTFLLDHAGSTGRQLKIKTCFTSNINTLLDIGSTFAADPSKEILIDELFFETLRFTQVRVFRHGYLALQTGKGVDLGSGAVEGTLATGPGPSQGVAIGNRVDVASPATSWGAVAMGDAAILLPAGSTTSTVAPGDLLTFDVNARGVVVATSAAPDNAVLYQAVRASFEVPGVGYYAQCRRIGAVELS